MHKHPREHTHDAVLFNCPVVLYNQPLPPDITFNVYPADAPPVFFGHYWLEDKMPAFQSHNVICLDYSVAKGGSLVAFRQGIGDTAPLLPAGLPAVGMAGRLDPAKAGLGAPPILGGEWGTGESFVFNNVRTADANHMVILIIYW